MCVWEAECVGRYCEWLNGEWRRWEEELWMDRTTDGWRLDLERWDFVVLECLT